MTRLILGTLAFSSLPQTVTSPILDEYFRLGGTIVDTASLYGNGAVERRLGEYLRNTKVPVSLSTKIGYFRNIRSYRTLEGLQTAFHQTCERLGTVPRFLFLHEADWGVWWNPAAHPGALLDPDAAFEWPDQLRSFKAFLEPFGTALGLSGNNAPSLQAVLRSALPDGVSVILLAKQFDLLWRTGRRLIDDLGSQTQIDCWLGAPYHQGWLFKLEELSVLQPHASSPIRGLRRLMQTNGLSLSSLAIPYLLAATSARIAVGPASVKELKRTFEATTTPLDPSVVITLEHLGFEGGPMAGPLAWEHHPV